MPLIKKRDTLSDLIQKAADKKKALHDERNRQNSAYMGWIDNNGELLPFLKHVWEGVTCKRSDADANNDPKELSERLLNLSSYFLMFVELKLIKICRFFAITLAILVLIIDTSSSTDDMHYLLEFKTIVDIIASIYYAIDGVAKMLSFASYMEVAEDLNQKMSLTTIMRRSGCIDVPLAALCLIYVNNYDVNKWMHLVRCVVISFFFLEQMPQLDVLLSGISAGLRSTIYTWLLLALTFVVYSATLVLLFSESDPYHFGNVGMAMWTCFELSTLENWSVVMNINYWGCDVYTSDVYTNGTEPQVIGTKLGSFYGPVCYAPKAKRIASSVVFVSFILVIGFILISLTVAFVATGINNRLHELQEEEDKEELLLEKSQVDPKRNSIFRRRSRRASSVLQRPTQVKLAPALSPVREDSGEGSLGRTSPTGRSFSITNTDGRTSPLASRRTSFRVNDMSSLSNIHSASHIGVGETRASFSRSSSGEGSGSGNSGGSVGPSIDNELLRALLTEIWGTKDIIKQQEEDEVFDATSTFSSSANMQSKKKSSSASGTDKKIERSRIEHFLLWLGVKTRSIVGNPYYHYFITLLIIYAAGVELVAAENRLSPFVINSSTLACQTIFSIDIAMRIAACAPKYMSFWDDRWNVFDSMLVLVLWVPYTPIDGGSFFELLKVLRILRLLKMLSWIFELNIIMKSISTSAKCLVYVIFMMLVFFFHFGVAGVYLFQQNDPFHFSNIGRALVTLLQVSTLDNWSDIARMNIYGCMHVGFDPEYCSEDRNNGWGWIAAWYFIIFIIIGVMVLVSLFVGVIITSMELLQISIKDESEMLKKVWTKQKEYKISNAMVASMLEIFDMVDLCANGRLTLNELKPVLAVIDLDESNQFEIFHRIDEDSSGKIDFSEFCELIMLIKNEYVESKVSFPDVVSRVIELNGDSETPVEPKPGNDKAGHVSQVSTETDSGLARKEPTHLKHMSNKIVSSFTETLFNKIQRGSTETKLSINTTANAPDSASPGDRGVASHGILDEPAFPSSSRVAAAPKPLSSAGSTASLASVVATTTSPKRDPSPAVLIPAGIAPTVIDASKSDKVASSGHTNSGASESLTSAAKSAKHLNFDGLSASNADVDDIETIANVPVSRGSGAEYKSIATGSAALSSVIVDASSSVSRGDVEKQVSEIDNNRRIDKSHNTYDNSTTPNAASTTGRPVALNSVPSSSPVLRQHTFPPDATLTASTVDTTNPSTPMASGSSGNASSGNDINGKTGITNNNKADVLNTLAVENAQSSETNQYGGSVNGGDDLVSSEVGQKSITSTRPSFTGKALTDTKLISANGKEMSVSNDKEGHAKDCEVAPTDPNNPNLLDFNLSVSSSSIPTKANIGSNHESDLKGTNVAETTQRDVSGKTDGNGGSSMMSNIPRIRWKRPLSAADRYKLTEKNSSN